MSCVVGSCYFEENGAVFMTLVAAKVTLGNSMAVKFVTLGSSFGSPAQKVGNRLDKHSSGRHIVSSEYKIGIILSKQRLDSHLI